MLDLSKKVSWLANNENLMSIVKGLEICENDYVLAICGSGDAAFAIAQYAKVTAIDININQINFAIARMNHLLGDDKDAFLITSKKEMEKYDVGFFSYGKPSIVKRNEYFLNHANLDKIKDNIKNIGFINSALHSHSGGYNKAYLSNAINTDMGIAAIGNLTRNMPMGGLVLIDLLGSNKDIEGFETSNSTFMLDNRLTCIARSYESNIFPTIFRKVE